MKEEIGGSQLHPEVSSLITDTDGSDYITHAFSDIGIQSLIILRTVFRVDNSYLGSYLARTLNTNEGLVRGKAILDLGCGCGLLGLVCALHGAKSVHFSDVNPTAVKSSRLNSILLDARNVSFSTGDLFENIPRRRRFDLIVFNPPSITGIPSSYSEAAFIREDRVIMDFYKLFSNYLRRGGAVIMPGSSRFDSETSPMNIVRRYNLKYEVVAEEEEEGDLKYVILIS